MRIPFLAGVDLSDPSSIISTVMLVLTILLVAIIVLGFLIGLTRRLWLNITRFAIFAGLLLIVIFISRSVGNAVMGIDLTKFTDAPGFSMTLGEVTYQIPLTTPLGVSEKLVEALYDFGGISSSNFPEMGTYVITLATGIINFLVFFILVILIAILMPIISLTIRFIAFIVRRAKVKDKAELKYKKPWRRVIGGAISGATAFMIFASIMTPLTSFIHTVNQGFNDVNNISPEIDEDNEMYNTVNTILDKYNGSFFDILMLGWLKDKEGTVLDSQLINYITDGKFVANDETINVSLNSELQVLAGIFQAFLASGALDENNELQTALLFQEETIKSLFYNLGTSGLIMSALPIVIQVLLNQPVVTDSISNETIKTNFKNKIGSLTRSEYESEFKAIEIIFLKFVELEIVSPTGGFDLTNLYEEDTIIEVFDVIKESKILRESYPVIVDVVLGLGGFADAFGEDNVNALRQNAADLDESEYANEFDVLRDIFVELVVSGALTPDGTFDFNQLFNKRSMINLLDALEESDYFMSSFGVLMSAVFTAQGLSNSIQPAMFTYLDQEIRDLTKTASIKEVQAMKNILTNLFDSGLADTVHNQLTAGGGIQTDNAFYEELLNVNKVRGLMGTLRSIDGGDDGSGTNYPASLIISRMLPAVLRNIADVDNNEIIGNIIPTNYADFHNYAWGSELSIIFETLAELMNIQPEIVNLISGEPSDEEFSWMDFLKDENKVAFRKALIGDFVKVADGEVNPSIDENGKGKEILLNPSFLDSDLVMENIDKIMKVMFNDFEQSEAPEHKIATIYFKAKLSSLHDDDIIQKRIKYKNNLDDLIDIYVNANNLSVINPDDYDPSVIPDLDDLPPLPDIDLSEWDDSEFELPPWVQEWLGGGH